MWAAICALGGRFYRFCSFFAWANFVEGQIFFHAWANFVGAELCGGQNLWKTKFLFSRGAAIFISDLGNFVGRRDTYESLIFA